MNHDSLFGTLTFLAAIAIGIWAAHSWRAEQRRRDQARLAAIARHPVTYTDDAGHETWVAEARESVIPEALAAAIAANAARYLDTEWWLMSKDTTS